jgi:predicted enzyme related to lactoylglutathione lyase
MLETRDVVVATIVHFEIPADNIERTKSFYSTLFDWEVKEIGWT